MPNSIKCLKDVEEHIRRLTFSIHMVGNGVDKYPNLMIAAMPPPQVLFKIRKEAVRFGELLQSLEDGFLNELAEIRK